jgi:hypothetical protein
MRKALRGEAAGLAILLAAAALLAARPAAAAEGKGPIEGGRYKIHILTIGQGDELFARFGHIGVVVDDRERMTRKVFNFGTFDFEDPALRIKYARGFLTYWLSVSSYRGLLGFYQYDNREVTLRTLALSPEQAAEVATRLEINARPENREYQYRHYLDNCCTRIRDLIDDAAGGAIRRGRDSKPTGRTFRDWTRRALEGMPIYSAVILYSLGPAIDRPITRWEEEFLPSVLSEDLDATRLPDGRKLVESSRVVLERRGPAVGAKVETLDVVVIAATGAVLAFGLLVPLLVRRRGLANRALGVGLATYGLIAGLGGLMLVLYWTATTHYDTHYNENLLVTPVTHLWLLGPGLKLLFTGRLGARTRRLLEVYAAAALGVVFLDVALKLGPFIQGNWGVIAFAAFADAALLTGLRRCR